ncbi:MAG: hypothetical protein KUG78_07580 [Kangiellaceae bacterium]|nr:hypothetical protein [Kangiellaceae bacterium]
MSKFRYGLFVGVMLSITGQLMYEQASDFQVATADETIFTMPTTEILAEQQDQAVISANPKNSDGTTHSDKQKSTKTFHEPSQKTIEQINSQLRRDKVLAMLEDFEDEDLVNIEKMLLHWNDKAPAEYFESESIDSSWAIEKQAELEYTFYEQSALRDLGMLDSIVCKSRTCQVVVKIPVSTQLKPSHYLDWSNPISVAIKDDATDAELKTIDIYISRER